MGKLTNTILLITGLIGGTYTGNKLFKERTKTTNYEVIQQHNNSYLQSRTSKKSIEIREINRGLYGGDLEHLIKGTKILKEEELRKKWRDTYE